MIASILVAGGVFAAAIAAADSPPAPAELKAYQEAKAKVGHDADAQVKLALWCEAHGLSAERIKHLTLATLANPGNAAARGLLGLVLYQGKWQRPDDVSRQAHDDPARQAILKEYLARRVRAADKPDDHWRLALWCDENGLKEQTTIHLRRVVTLDPKREAAWRRLGFKKQGSQWVKPELAAAEKTEFEAQTPRQQDLEAKARTPGRRAECPLKGKSAAAEEALGEITDPCAVPMVWAVFVRGDRISQRFAVRVLGQIDASGSSRGLPSWACSAPGRMSASRPPQSCAAAIPAMSPSCWSACSANPIKYRVKKVNGPGSQGELLVEGRGRQRQAAVYSPRAAVTLDARLPVEYGREGNASWPTKFSILRAPLSGVVSGYLNPDRSYALSCSSSRSWITTGPEQAAAGARQWPGMPIRVVIPDPEPPRWRVQITPLSSCPGYDHHSAGTDDGRYSRVLCSRPHSNNFSRDVAEHRARATHRFCDQQYASGNSQRGYSGQDFGQDQQAWINWAVTDRQAYAISLCKSAQSPPPTIVEQVPIDYQPQASGIQIGEGDGHHSAHDGTQPLLFWRGNAGANPGWTAVHREISEGEAVLTQNTTTGAHLSYQPVVVAYHNPPNATFRIDLGNDSIVATGIHRFWKAGHGWVMARELKARRPTADSRRHRSREGCRARQGPACLQPPARQRRQLLCRSTRRPGRMTTAS